MMRCDFFFFFFQAEDGIRDTSVTGVQTCALPIYFQERQVCAGIVRFAGVGVEINEASHGADHGVSANASRSEPLFFRARSEERRVGKECRSRGWMDY